MGYIGDTLSVIGDEIDHALENQTEMMLALEIKVAELAEQVTELAAALASAQTTDLHPPIPPPDESEPEPEPEEVTEVIRPEITIVDDLAASVYGVTLPRPPQGVLQQVTLGGADGYEHIPAASTVTLTGNVGTLDIFDKQDVEVFIPSGVRVQWVRINNSRRIRIRGAGVIGALQTYNQCEDVTVADVVMDGNNNDANGYSCFEIIGCSRFMCQNVSSSDRPTGYFVWSNASNNVTLRACKAHTGGRQALIRFEDVVNSLVHESNLSSDGNYVYRLHRATQNATFANNMVVGPRGVMLGTHSGDRLADVRILNNRFFGTSISTLGMPMEEPARLARFLWQSNIVTDGLTEELPHYRGVREDWVIE